MTWAEDMKAAHDEAGGLMQLDLIRLQAVPGMMADALAGDREASRLLGAVNDILAGMRRAPRNRMPLCLCCPRSLRRDGFMVGVATPARSDPSKAIGFAICDRCSADPNAVTAKALVGLRRIWPDLQPVVVTHPEGGRA